MPMDYRNYTVDGVKMTKSNFNIDWLSKYLKNEPNVILEFGSYDGGDGVFYKQSFPNAEVHCLEACPERFGVISKLDEKFGVKTHNFAVCDIDGQIDFYQVKDPNVMDHEGKFGSSGSINKRTEKYKQTFDHIDEQVPIKVPCVRLDTFCKNNDINKIDFMHVDVEGAEHKVVKGFGDLRPTILWMETHLGKDFYGENAYDVSELDQDLLNLGYEKILRQGADTLYVFKRDIK